MSIGFQKKEKIDRGWVDGLSSIQVFLDVWIFLGLHGPLKGFKTNISMKLVYQYMTSFF